MSLVKRLIVFLIIVLGLGLLAFYWPVITGSAVVFGNSPETTFVNRVIDGDTIVVSGDYIGNNTHIRLLGINTPEHDQPYFQEAKDFLSEQIENKTVELVKDGNDKDKYGRSLRYIFYNNRLINLEVVQKGFAPTLMIDKLKYKDKFVAAEKFARDNRLRLWEKSIDKCGNCIKLSELDPIQEFFIIKNICDFNCDLNNWFVKDDANHFFYLTNLNSGEAKEYDSPGKSGTTSVWNNDKDRFFMRDKNGGLVIFYEYTNESVKNSRTKVRSVSS